MTFTLSRIALTGGRLALTLLAVAAVFAVLGILGRRVTALRRIGFSLTIVAIVLAGAVELNTRTRTFPTLASVFGRHDLPRVNQLHPSSNVELQKGAAARISVPDTASHFGVFDAQVYLPPQYFTDPTRRFPVVILMHGNPGTSSDWLEGGQAAETGLAVADSGHPVILVMPTVLQTPTGDSLCVDTTTQGNAETYVVKDVVAAADSQLRTIPDANHRAIGGFSMGGFCALNLGLKHQDVFRAILAFSALTVCEPDAIEGGNEALFDSPDWEQEVAENSPADYWPELDPRTSPPMWLDVGEDEPTVQPPLEEFADKLGAAGFTVEYHSRPGGHDFATWTAALQESLPWAAARIGA